MNTFHFNYRPRVWLTAFALSAFVVGCGSGSDDPAAAPDEPVAPVVDPVGAACTGGGACVPLLTAGKYVILTGDQGVTATGTSAITGHVGSNVPASAMTGFSQTVDASGTFATSAQVIGGGRLYANTYAPPTPAELTQAVADAAAAFGIIDGMTNSGETFVNVGAGNLTARTLPAGVYEWNTGVSVDAASTVTLNGSATAVWVFRIAGGITMNPGATVTLTGGALPQNVFWRSADVVALNTTANLKGIVLSGTSVTMANGASVNGRLIATNNVTLNTNTVTRP